MVENHHSMRKCSKAENHWHHRNMGNGKHTLLCPGLQVKNWGFKPRPSCFCSQPFVHWASSPAPKHAVKCYAFLRDSCCKNDMDPEMHTFSSCSRIPILAERHTLQTVLLVKRNWNASHREMEVLNHRNPLGWKPDMTVCSQYASTPKAVAEGELVWG